MRRSHAPCSNPCSVGGWRSVSLTILISSDPSMPLAPGGFLSDMLSSPRSCTLQSHSRTVEYGRISRSRILRMLASVFLSQHAARTSLAFPDGRPQSSQGWPVCLYRAGDHCPSAGYQDCSILRPSEAPRVFAVREGGRDRSRPFGLDGHVAADGQSERILVAGTMRYSNMFNDCRQNISRRKQFISRVLQAGQRAMHHLMRGSRLLLVHICQD